MHKGRLIWILNLALAVWAVTPLSAVAQGISTPEERARWVEVTHKLESSPLDESVNKDGEWALNRLRRVARLPEATWSKSMRVRRSTIVARRKVA
jgi:hypothetical protein